MERTHIKDVFEGREGAWQTAWCQLRLELRK